jgi:chemotaxis protein CheD
MEAETVTVNMSGMEVVTDGKSLKTILGSCVAVIVRDPDRRVSGLAHIMLPTRRKNDGVEGKYADSAIPALLARLASCGCRADALQALLIGGAQMFAAESSSIGAIGDLNVEAARRILQEQEIPIIYEDTGGRAGRAVVFENTSGKVTVRTLQAL